MQTSILISICFQINIEIMQTGYISGKEREARETQPAAR